MEYKKQRTLTAMVTTIVSIGMVSSLIFSLPILNQVLAQSKTEHKTGMMNTGSEMNTGTMNANITMDQMMDMMDMMHNMMMNMMRMMAHGDMMEGGNMTSNMTSMAGMQ